MRHTAVSRPVRRVESSSAFTVLATVALVSCALLMIELALTRIFSVTMFYHFAFLAISIALFGLSASGVYVYLLRDRFSGRSLSDHALAFSFVTVAALLVLVRLRVGLTYSPQNLLLMLAIYGMATLPFFTGGAVVSLAFTRYTESINLVYAADLTGAAAGCLLLLPALNHLGAPGAVLAASTLAAVAAMIAAPDARRTATRAVATLLIVGPWMLHAGPWGMFDVTRTKGHDFDRILFSKWNSFSRVAVYARSHGDWSLSPRYTGPLPQTLFMDIDSAASTPIVGVKGKPAEERYLRFELTALAYDLRANEVTSQASVETGREEGKGPAVAESAHLLAGNRSIPDRGPLGKTEGRGAQLSRIDHGIAPGGGFTALVIGPGGGRDLLSALVFGARRVDGVEINPIIVDDVMLGRFRGFSGAVYADPRVRVVVDDGRSFVRRSTERYDVIQASLIDTWAATAAGAYTLTENTLYTVEAFDDYLDHLSDRGVLSVTRWVADGLRLVSLAQEACARRGGRAEEQVAVVELGRVATFLLKKTPFTPAEVDQLEALSHRLGFEPLYLPARPGRGPVVANQDGSLSNDYARLLLAADRNAFYRQYRLDVTPTTDDRPFFFHTTKITDQASVAFGRSMLFGNGLSALLTLMGISGLLVVAFIVGPLALTSRAHLAAGWPRWLAYFSSLGAGFMLIEVGMLQRFVLLLGHPVYSLTVTLFSLLLGTGLGSFASRRIPLVKVAWALRAVLAGVILVALAGVVALPGMVSAAVQASLELRILLAMTVLLPAGVIMGVALPAGMRLMVERAPAMVPWAWGMNGAFSVVGSTCAVFVAMNWGFGATLVAGAACYALALTLTIRE